MQRDVEGEAGIFPAEQPGHQDQMRGAADRQKFGERLNDSENDDLVDRHELVIVAHTLCVPRWHSCDAWRDSVFA